MKIISIRENPEFSNIAIAYFQKSWPDVLPIIYEDDRSRKWESPGITITCENKYKAPIMDGLTDEY